MSPRAKKSQATSSAAERYAAGKALRQACPRESHGIWKAPAGRAGAVEMVLAAEKGRMPELLPLRHGRMVRSAFTFYRGSALPMAADPATTPVSGLRVQCCGDAHLSTSAATPRRSGGSSSRSTTSTRPFQLPGNGTSSASARASSLPAGMPA